MFVVIVDDNMPCWRVWDIGFKTRESAWKEIDTYVARRLSDRVVGMRTKTKLLLDYEEGGFSHFFEIQELEDNPYIVIQAVEGDELLWDTSFKSVEDAKTAIRDFTRMRGCACVNEFEIDGH